MGLASKQRRPPAAAGSGSRRRPSRCCRGRWRCRARGLRACRNCRRCTTSRVSAAMLASRQTCSCRTSPHVSPARPSRCRATSSAGCPMPTRVIWLRGRSTSRGSPRLAAVWAWRCRWRPLRLALRARHARLRRLATRRCHQARARPQVPGRRSFQALPAWRSAPRETSDDPPAERSCTGPPLRSCTGVLPALRPRSVQADVIPVTRQTATWTEMWTRTGLACGPSVRACGAPPAVRPPSRSARRCPGVGAQRSLLPRGRRPSARTTARSTPTASWRATTSTSF
mmetsp:Transcript_16739/g.52511  ORF Transcript_16739/g.52511 Transcript_16739/m.52511 type:complete len:284 (-) Transcript_16739:472-1323(-)